VYLPARKYALILAAIMGSVAIPAALLRLTPWEFADTWGRIQWASIFLLTLTLPVSFGWLIVAAFKKQWKAVQILVAALLIPVLAWIAGMSTNFKILDSGLSRSTALASNIWCCKSLPYESAVVAALCHSILQCEACLSGVR
jgi:hypothetical protein